jgi:hypothetical protein
MKERVGPLGSVLGRRLLLLFIACAFLPIVGFAWLSLGKVTTTLERMFLPVLDVSLLKTVG